MNRTKIDWPGLAYSWNPIVGCAGGCSYCYAKKLNDRFKFIPDWTKPQFFPERLNEPLKVKKPSTIFVGSMCDIFSKGVQIEWLDSIIDITKKCQQHKFMFLTKKPDFYHDYTWPMNCWLGATVEHSNNFKMIVRLSEIRSIADIGINKTFLSIEPIMGIFEGLELNLFDLIIVGADSSRDAEIPPIEWIKSIHHHNIWYKKNIIKYYPELIPPVWQNNGEVLP